MPETNDRRKKIMEILVSVVFPAFIFGMLFFWQSGGLGAGEETDAEMQTEIRSAKVREALHAVERIEPLSDAVFRSADFNSLVDFTPQVLPVPLGRPDPFTRPAGLTLPLNELRFRP